jgi:DNA replication protein DnaC
MRPARGIGYRGISWQAHTFADLLARLRPRTGVDTEAELERYRKLDLLLIDDLAAGKSSEWVEEATYRIINGRYEAMRPTIYTSNLPLDQLRDAIGDRIASRLAETCTRVVMEGPDRRRMPS